MKVIQLCTNKQPKVSLFSGFCEVLTVRLMLDQRCSETSLVSYFNTANLFSATAESCIGSKAPECFRRLDLPAPGNGATSSQAEGYVQFRTAARGWFTMRAELIGHYFNHA